MNQHLHHVKKKNIKSNSGLNFLKVSIVRKFPCKKPTAHALTLT